MKYRYIRIYSYFLEGKLTDSTNQFIIIVDYCLVLYYGETFRNPQKNFSSAPSELVLIGPSSCVL